MKYLFALLLAVAMPAFAATTYVWVAAPETGAASQGWFPSSASYFQNTEVIRQFNAGTEAGTNIDTQISLNTIMPAGSYRVWVGMALQTGSGTNMMVSVPSIGDTSVAQNEFIAFAVTNLGSFTSGIQFSNFTLRITKLAPAGTEQKYYLSSVGILPLSYQSIEVNDSFFVDYTYPTTTNTDFAVGNLIPNGDFELGMNGGWSYTRLTGPGGYSPWLLSAIDTASPSHGLQCAKLNGFNAAGSLKSPTVRVRGGVIGNYTLSFDVKGEGPLLTVQWGPVFAVTNVYVTNHPATSWTFTPSATWTRYSTNFNFVPLPTRLFYVNFSQNNVTADSIFIDQVQLVEGTSTNFMDHNQIEMGLSLGVVANILNTNVPRNVTIQFQNNTGVNTNVTFNYEVTGQLARRMQAGVSNYTIPPGFSTTNLLLATTNTGPSQVAAWLTESVGHRDELAFTVVPFPVNPTKVTNTLFGVHENIQTQAAQSNMVWGFSTFNRTLSPGEIARWTVIETSSNSFSWTALDQKLNEITNSQIIYLSLSTSEPGPSWAMTNGYPKLNLYSNYIYQVVDHTKDRVSFFASMNEPNDASGYDYAEYAGLLEMEALAVKAAAPNSYFVAFELGTVQGFFVTNVWNLLSATAKANIDAISCHLYPAVATDLNDNDYTAADDMYRIDVAMTWGTFTGKPVWQTESGFNSIGLRRGTVVGGKRFSAGVFPSLNEEVFRRGMMGGEVTMRGIINGVGAGMQKWFYYDNRKSGIDVRQADTQPSMWTPGYDALTAGGSALLWGKRFMDTPTNGIANLTNGTIRAWLFARSTETVLAMFAQNRSNYDVTVTNGSFEALDLYGNRLTTNALTVRVGRSPVYWRSTTLTTNQMMDNFTFATATLGADITAPNVAIDITPFGRVKENQLPLQFFWTAMDEFKINTSDYNTNVVTRYRFPGLTEWSGWSAERIATLTSIPLETYLEVQASDLFGNQSASVTGPLFGNAYPPESATNRLNVIGTANIGTITVVPP